MFGNRIEYYGGPGGIRRGLIWQNGNEITPEWIIPEQEYVRGEMNVGGFWGSLFFGGVQAVQRVTRDDPPVSAVWTHDPGPVTVYYNRRKKVIKCDFEWDYLSNTPAEILGASTWEFAPDYQPGSVYAGTVWMNWTNHQLDGPGIRFPILHMYRYSDGSGATLHSGSRISWRGDPWSAAGYPFDKLIRTSTDDYNTYDIYLSIPGISITLYLISSEIMLINPRKPTESYPYRVAGAAVISGKVNSWSGSDYVNGAWQFTLKNVVVPSWLIYNLTNSP